VAEFWRNHVVSLDMDRFAVKRCIDTGTGVLKVFVRLIMTLNDWPWRSSVLTSAIDLRSREFSWSYYHSSRKLESPR
jgi:hypothetical protein